MVTGPSNSADAELCAVMDTMPIPAILIRRTQNTIAYCNHLAAAISGESRDDLIGKSVNDYSSDQRFRDLVRDQLEHGDIAEPGEINRLTRFADTTRQLFEAYVAEGKVDELPETSREFVRVVSESISGDDETVCVVASRSTDDQSEPQFFAFAFASSAAYF